jgi:hypothetical protein
VEPVVRASRFVVPILILVAAPVEARGQSAEPSPKVRAELMEVRELAWRAWFGGDQKTLSTLLPPEFVGIASGDSVWSDHARALSGAAKFVADGGKLINLEFPKTIMQVYGDAAFLYSTYVARFTQGSDTVTMAGRCTEVFLKRGGRWIHPGWHLDSGM